MAGTLARFDLNLGTANQLDNSDNGWFYHYDEAGNVILITDKSGNIQDQFEQDYWGNDINNTFASACLPYRDDSHQVEKSLIGGIDIRTVLPYIPNYEYSERRA